MDYTPITITNMKNILIMAFEVTVIKSRIVFWLRIILQYVFIKCPYLSFC